MNCHSPFWQKMWQKNIIKNSFIASPLEPCFVYKAHRRRISCYVGSLAQGHYSERGMSQRAVPAAGLPTPTRRPALGGVPCAYEQFTGAAGCDRVQGQPVQIGWAWCFLLRAFLPLLCSISSDGRRAENGG